MEGIVALTFLQPKFVGTGYGDRFVTWGVILVSTVIVLALASVTRDMTCIPTDAQSLYLPAARQLSAGSPPSALHENSAQGRFLYGKEMLIAQFAWSQWALHDHDSLWPLTLVCILAWGIASVMVFIIARRYWGMAVGLVTYVLFITSFWSYLYVLMVKHPSVAVCYVLLAVAFLQNIKGQKTDWMWAGLSGLCWGTAFFSSTATAVWLPLYAAAFLYQVLLVRRVGHGKMAVRAIGLACVITGGFLLIAGYVNYPQVLRHLSDYWQGYWSYVHSSSDRNLFYCYQDLLKEWLPDPAKARGGWTWTFQYLALVMPVLFPVFIFCAGGFLAVLMLNPEYRRRHWATDSAMVALSVSPLCLMEGKRIAQYGANYFPAFVGLLMLVAYALARAVRPDSAPRIAPRAKTGIILAVLALHIVVNGQVFFRDVLPTRMTASRLSRELEARGINELYLYYNNRMTRKIVAQLSPAFFNKLRIGYIKNLYQARDGYILIPPLVVSSVYFGMNRPNADFDEDVYLNGMVLSGEIEKYAVITMDTMATSRIWRQETEVASYRDLVLHQFSDEYLKKSRVWVLDAKKLYQDREKHPPAREDLEKVMTGVRDIGGVSGNYRFKGFFLHASDFVPLEQITFRVYRVGTPRDELVAYVYKRTEDMGGLTYVPAAVEFSSEPVAAARLSDDPRGRDTTFHFKKPVELTPGDYSVVVYRTGKPDRSDFYRIFVDEGEKELYIQAAGVR
jgi:hypothetical protein